MTVATRTVKTLLTLLAALLFQLAFPRHVCAQAWLPPKGEGNFSILYQNLFVRNHLFADGSRLNSGRIRSSGVVMDFDYGLTDKVAVNVSLPYITSKYNGPRPHQLPIDGGEYHGTFQDFRIGLRYNVRMRPFVVSPFVEGIVPSHHYEYFAHSAVGTDLKELQFGVNLGRRLDPILPRAYFQTRYSYGIVQRTLGIRPNRSRLDSELGYFVTKRLSLSAIEMLQISHSGLDFPQDFPSRTDELWHHHDQISRINLLNVGIGGAFAVTKSVEFFTSALTNVWGQNGHSLNRGLTFGVNWNFRTRRFVRQAFAGEGNAGGSCAVLCRKCERLFQPPDSVTPALTASLTSGR